MKGKLIALRRATGEPAQMSDVALVAACAVGEAGALGALFDRHRATVQRFLARLAGVDARSADDLVQETFLQIYRSASRFGGRSSVRTWVLGIAVNVARHHTRAESRRRAATTNLVDLPRPTTTRPDDAAGHRQFVVRLERALAALSPELREVFALCDLEEISGAEAARALGLREGTLWWRLSAARKALRVALEEMSP